jgi:hypothetical protein
MVARTGLNITFTRTFPVFFVLHENIYMHELWLDRGADKSLARPTSRCILFDIENISFDASLVFIYLYIYIYIYIYIALIFLQL